MLFNILKLFGLDIPAKIEAAKASFELRAEQVADHVKRVAGEAAVIAALSAIAAVTAAMAVGGRVGRPLSLDGGCLRPLCGSRHRGHHSGCGDGHLCDGRYDQEQIAGGQSDRMAALRCRQCGPDFRFGSHKRRHRASFSRAAFRYECLGTSDRSGAGGPNRFRKRSRGAVGSLPFRIREIP